MPNDKKPTSMESNGGMYFEPLRPSAPLVNQDKSIPDPNPQIVQPKIMPNPKAGEGWRKQLRPIPANPTDVIPPNPTGVVKI